LYTNNSYDPRVFRNYLVFHGKERLGPLEPGCLEFIPDLNNMSCPYTHLAVNAIGRLAPDVATHALLAALRRARCLNDHRIIDSIARALGNVTRRIGDVFPVLLDLLLNSPLGSCVEAQPMRALTDLARNDLTLIPELGKTLQPE